jgi:hypothetical protein
VRAASLGFFLLIGCATGPSPRDRDAVLPDPSAQDRHASQDTCPENGRVVFHEIGEDGVARTLAIHCGGWLDDCNEDEPGAPHLEVETSYPREAEFDESYELPGVYPIEFAQASAVWRVAEQSHWRTWESCSGEGARPRWVVEIDDGDMGVVRISCDGHLPSAWRATLDSLESLKSAGCGTYDYDYDSKKWCAERKSRE